MEAAIRGSFDQSRARKEQDAGRPCPVCDVRAVAHQLHLNLVETGLSLKMPEGLCTYSGVQTTSPVDPSLKRSQGLGLEGLGIQGFKVSGLRV